MIARLRARHRRAWLVLAALLPAVLGAALAGRRGAAIQKAVPAALRSETVVAPVPLSGDDAPGDIRWHRDASSGRAVLELRQRRLPQGRLEPDVLLYWTAHPPQEVRAFLDPPSDEAGRVGAASAFFGASLPADAVLLGPSRSEGAQLYVVPDGFPGAEGALVWWDLADARLRSADRAPDPPAGLEAPR